LTWKEDNLPEEDEPKSAFEIAMEKLKASGDAYPASLTDEQKAEIAEIRSRFRAKVAELEIRHQDEMKKAVAQRSFEEIEKLNQRLAAEKARLHQEEESLLQKAREARK
jgi:uncharacterized protein (DUF885 family)